MRRKKINKILNLILILLIIEVIISSMLTFAKYTNSIDSICGSNISNSCNIVQNSKFSNIVEINENSKNKIEIPYTLVGIFFYSIFIYFIIIFKNRKGKINKVGRKMGIDRFKNKINNRIGLIIFILGILGLLMSIIFTLVQAFLIKEYCKYCLFSAFNTTIIFVLVSYIYFKSK